MVKLIEVVARRAIFHADGPVLSSLRHIDDLKSGTCSRVYALSLFMNRDSR